MIIEKKPILEAECKRSYHAYASARLAFKAYLASLHFTREEKVLLPAYIGWSSREGSGVFDPITELSLQPEFYRLDNKLFIDVDDYKTLILKGGIKAVVIIHYFGFVDPNYNELVAFAHKNNVAVLEDEAHAMLTDLVGGTAGRLGDASIFSLHKMLPVSTGGVLVYNDDVRVSSDIVNSSSSLPILWEYDLKKIASKRLENTRALVELLRKCGSEIDILRVPKNGEVPQTLPIIIKNVCRDRLYELMNESGYGVVSLYHTLIDRLTKDAYPDSHYVARRILNLPVHQDIEVSRLPQMVDTLMDHIASLKV